MEAQMKMKRMNRDLPKFMSAQKKFMMQIDSQIKNLHQQTAERLGLTPFDFLQKESQPIYERETIEDVLSRQYESYKL
jgi:hypothetical protein